MVLITVRPGPVLHVWRDGQQVAEVPLTTDAALVLMASILNHIPRTQGGNT